MAPRKHAALIHAFADGAEIEFKAANGQWRDDPKPLFLDDCEYRIKPAAPGYPETTMSGADLHRTYCESSAFLVGDALVTVANAVLRHAIDTGLVAPKEAYDQVNTALAEAERRLGRCEARELAVAEAVREAVFKTVRDGSPSFWMMRVNGLNLHAIIASVP